MTTFLRAVGAVFPSLMFLIVLFALCYSAAVFYGLERWLTEVSWATSISFFSNYYIEVALMFLLLMLPGYRALRIVSVGFIILVYCIQVNALWLSNDYVSVLVLENIEAINMIVSTDSLEKAFQLCASILLGVLGLAAGLRYFSREDKIGLNVTIIIVICMMTSGVGFFYSDSAEAGSPKLNRKMSPLLAAFSLGWDYFGGPLEPITTMKSSDFDIADYGINLDLDSDYPMMKDKLYRDSLPFQVVSEEKMNVIVFFVEALSARKLSRYGGTFSDLTPNLDAFASGALQINNYFSHTQSTFRGIRGQLCSMFPYYTTRPNEWGDPNFVPPQTRYKCLPHLLTDVGYETIFLGPDDENHMHFRDQMETIGFTTNYYRSQILDSFLASRKTYGGFLTDVQMARALREFLIQKKSGQPFFITVYFKGSHVGQDSKPDGVKYKDGENRILNTLHTFDAAFGEFWEYFQDTEYAKNTIVIVTGDHAHWPEREYIKIAGEGFNRTPVDKIALFISSPAHRLPKFYDAANATSLTFAPTISQLLGLNHRPNHFLGYSLFDDHAPPYSVAWFNNDLYIIAADGLLDHYKVNKAMPDKVSRIWGALHRTHYAELNDQILPAVQAK